MHLSKKDKRCYNTNYCVTMIFSALFGFFIMSGGFSPYTAIAEVVNNSINAVKYVKVDGRRVVTDYDNNGKYDPYFIKGVVYSPVPIGGAPNTATMQNPLDNMDILARDLSVIQMLYANTIRILKGNDTFAKDSSPVKITAKTLQYAEKYGLKVIAGFYTPKLDFTSATVRSDIKARFNTFVGSFKNSKAILFWTISTDKFNGSAEAANIRAWHSLVNEMAGSAHSLEGVAFHPVALITDDRQYIGNSALYASTDSSLNNVDIWGLSTYPGNSFGDLFTSYKSLSNKPLWISEYGMDAWYATNTATPSSGYIDETVQAETDIKLWDEIAKNTDVTVGGTIMEYSDEWWRPSSTNASTHDYLGRTNSAFGDKYMNDEWFGLMDVRVDPAKPSGLNILTFRQVYSDLQERFLLPVKFNIPRVHFISLSITPSATAGQQDINFQLKNIGNMALASGAIVRVRVYTRSKSSTGVYSTTYKDYSNTLPVLSVGQEYTFSSVGKWVIPAAPVSPNGLNEVRAYIDFSLPVYGDKEPEQAVWTFDGAPMKLKFFDEVAGNDILGDGSYEKPFRTTEYNVGRGVLKPGDKVAWKSREGDIVLAPIMPSVESLSNYWPALAGFAAQGSDSGSSDAQLPVYCDHSEALSETYKALCSHRRLLAFATTSITYETKLDRACTESIVGADSILAEHNFVKKNPEPYEDLMNNDVLTAMKHIKLAYDRYLGNPQINLGDSFVFEIVFNPVNIIKGTEGSKGRPTACVPSNFADYYSEEILAAVRIVRKAKPPRE